MNEAENQAPQRMGREKQTIRAMVEIFCRDQHGTPSGLCAECQGLCEYAFARLDHCPFGEDKPTCAKCPIHCYKPAMREQVRTVMAYAGPRMLLRHPLLAVRHQLDGLRASPPHPKRRDQSTQES